MKSYGCNIRPPIDSGRFALLGRAAATVLDRIERNGLLGIARAMAALPACEVAHLAQLSTVRAGHDVPAVLAVFAVVAGLNGHRSPRGKTPEKLDRENARSTRWFG